MINHFRTLLLNRNGEEGFSADTPGEEFVPPEYKARRLPPSVRLPLQTLFGISPDRAFLNFRLRQLLQIVHSTELADHITACDPRITYWPFVSDDYFDETFAATVTKTNGYSTAYLMGSHVADEARGRCYANWSVTVFEEGTANVLQMAGGSGPAVQSVYTAAAGLSSPVPLTGSDLHIRFTSPAEGSRWTVTSFARPVQDIGALLLRLEVLLGQGGLDVIMGNPLVEPYATYKSIMDTHPAAGYRFSALLLALAHRIEESPV